MNGVSFLAGAPPRRFPVHCDNRTRADPFPKIPAGPGAKTVLELPAVYPNTRKTVSALGMPLGRAR
jgi:hypothetical protein